MMHPARRFAYVLRITAPHVCCAIATNVFSVIHNASVTVDEVYSIGLYRSCYHDLSVLRPCAASYIAQSGCRCWLGRRSSHLSACQEKTQSSVVASMIQEERSVLH